MVLLIALADTIFQETEEKVCTFNRLELVDKSETMVVLREYSV